MPEYLAPGVFVEEVSYRAKSIEGVSTTTTGFIGPARYGPVEGEPELLTSLVEFERVYGDGARLEFASGPMHNYLWHAARAFFENGGKRLYVQRVFTAADGAEFSGYANRRLDGGADGRSLTVRSRFPGAAASMRVDISLSLGPNMVAQEAAPGSPGVMQPVLRGLQDRDVVWVSRSPEEYSPPDSPPSSPPSSPPELPPRRGAFFAVTGEETDTGTNWTFTALGSPPATALDPANLRIDDRGPEHSDEMRAVTATVVVHPAEEDGISQVWSGLAMHPDHESFGIRDSLLHQFDPDPDNPAWRRTIPIVLEPENLDDGLQVLAALFAHDTGLQEALSRVGSTPDERTFSVLLDGGNDGVRPTAAEYEGDADDIDDKSGLKAFEDLEEISIVAAPGSTFGYENGYRAQATTILGLLISHAQRMRYRIAVLDSADGQDVTQVRAMRAGLDSKHAALYYPWVRVLDPITQEQIVLPPSGFVSGIYARNDIERAVYKAPANEVVTLALGFERMLNKSQQEVLNPEGINCLRYFEGRGNRVWGARTISSDPEWKYVNLRRYFAYLERSIDVGTQWAVFEPNGPQLWANVRRTISDFLFNEFVMGAYLGDKPETSYFVKCDRSTMTQNDIDNGRLVCLIGVAVVKPAEFVIFRVGQWTADAKR